MNIGRDLANAIYRTDFGAFTCRAFEAINPGQQLIPNWHIDVICYHLQLMVNGEARKRLVLNLPQIASAGWLHRCDRDRRVRSSGDRAGGSSGRRKQRHRHRERDTDPRLGARANPARA